MNLSLIKCIKCTNCFLVFFFLFLIVFVDQTFSQNLLNNPESVIYDSLYDRYLVSNHGTGDVIQIDSLGIQTPFVTNQQCYRGLHIVDSVLYASCTEFGVKGFDLANGTTVLNVVIPASGDLNDITSDTSGHLYISSPSAGKVFKIDILSQISSVLIDSGLNTPNGVYFDEHNFRLIIVSSISYPPIQAFNFSDSTLSTITSTNLHYLDGLTRDNNGNFYVSSWYSNTIYRFDSTFINPPVIFSTHNDDPADISFNEIDNLIAVPLFYTHQIELIPITTSVEEIAVEEIFDVYNLDYINSSSCIYLNLPEDCKISLTLYNVLGERVMRLSEGYYIKGRHFIPVQSCELASGTYFIQLSVGELLKIKKFFLLQ